MPEKDKLLLAPDGHYGIQAISTSTASPRWKCTLKRPMSTQPTACSDRVYFATSDGTVLSLSRNTGSQIWRTQTAQNSKYLTKPLYSHQMLFLVSTQGAIQALDAKTGVQLWRTNLDGRCTYTPTVSQRDFYVTGSDSSIHCFDRVSGDHIWQESLDSRPSSRILVESDSLYTLSDSGSLYAFSQSRDETKFVNEVTPLTGASGIAITAKGNIAGVNREGEIVIFDGDTGKMQINSSDYHTTTGGLFLADTHFYACQNDILYSMNYDGSRRWSVLLESKPEYIIALDDLYVTVVEGGGERTIHRYTPSGEQRWSPQIGGVLKYSIEPTGYANREIRPVVSAK